MRALGEILYVVDGLDECDGTALAGITWLVDVYARKNFLQNRHPCGTLMSKTVFSYLYTEGESMASLSTYACIAALRSGVDCSDVFDACLRLVTVLVKEKKYNEIVEKDIRSDFLKRFKFTIPYHAMVTIIKKGIKSGVFEYNSGGRVFPVWSTLEFEDYMNVLSTKKEQFDTVIKCFKEFLIAEYDLHVSTEDAIERLESFIEVHGIEYRVSSTVARKAGAESDFAAFLVHCEESGMRDIISDVNEIILGMAFVELLTFHENTTTFSTNRGIKVYLDTMSI